MAKKISTSSASNKVVFGPKEERPKKYRGQG